MRIGSLDRSQLAAAELVLADSCAFDRATEVAEETLFAAAPLGPMVPGQPTELAAAHAFGAWQGDELIGVAAVSSRWLRVVAVVPSARGRGAGGALLEACAEAARASGETKLRSLDA